MNITKKFLKKHDACPEGIKWWIENGEEKSPEILIKKLIKKHPDWASWLILRLLKRKDKIRYAVYAVKLVLPVFEKEYPREKRPRKAIEAAEAVIRRDSKRNRNVAYASAHTASFTNYPASSFAAYTASCVGYANVYANSAYIHTTCTIPAYKKILNYGLKLLRSSK